MAFGRRFARAVIMLNMHPFCSIHYKRCGVTIIYTTTVYSFSVNHLTACDSITCLRVLVCVYYLDTLSYKKIFLLLSLRFQYKLLHLPKGVCLHISPHIDCLWRKGKLLACAAFAYTNIPVPSRCVCVFILPSNHCAHTHRVLQISFV